MRGLIIKDFLALKNNWKTMIIFFIGSLLVSIALGNYLLCICALPILLLTSSINTFQTDEFFNTESFTLTYPLSRKQIVSSRYLYTLIMAIISLFIGLVIYYLIYFIIHPDINGLNPDMLKYLVMLDASSLLVNALFYPIIYKFGCEKSKMVMMSIVMLLIGLASIASVYLNVIVKKELDFTNVVNFIENNGAPILCVAVLVISVISYFLSVLAYRHRDF